MEAFRCPAVAHRAGCRMHVWPSDREGAGGPMTFAVADDMPLGAQHGFRARRRCAPCAQEARPISAP